MSAEKPNPFFSRRTLLHGLIGVLLLAAFIWTGLYLTGAGFQQVVLRKVVAELEMLTGGKVEMRQFTWNLSRLAFQADDLTIHGLEAAGVAPYAHADRVRVRLKIRSFFSREVGLQSFEADRPIIHITVDAQGNTNQPMPKIRLSSHHSPIERLFDLAIESAQFNNGEFWWNDRRIPLDLRAEQAHASMNLAGASNRLIGSVHIGRIESRLSDFRPVASDAEIEFSLSRFDLEIRALRWKSGGSHLEASGTVTNFQDPKVNLAYSLSVDLKQAAAITGNAELRGGRADFNGRGSATFRDFATDGKLFVHDLQWEEPRSAVRFPPLNAQAQFVATPRRLALSHMDGRIAGGTITGVAEVAGWSLMPATSMPPTAGQHRSTAKGSADLQFKNLDLAELDAAISKSQGRLQQLRPAGRVNAESRVAWEGTFRNLTATLAAQVEPLAQTPANFFPVKGDLQAVYSRARRTLEISDGHLQTSHTSLVAKGTLAADKSSRLIINLKTADLRELEPVWTALNVPRP